MAPHFNLSFWDLLQIPEFKKAAQENDKEVMESVLWKAGMNTSLPFQFHDCLHRPLSSNQPWQGIRIEGFERTDREHIDSGICTMEAYIAASGNGDMQDALNSLNPDKLQKESLYEDDKILACEISEGDEWEDESLWVDSEEITVD